MGPPPAEKTFSLDRTPLEAPGGAGRTRRQPTHSEPTAETGNRRGTRPGRWPRPGDSVGGFLEEGDRGTERRKGRSRGAGLGGTGDAVAAVVVEVRDVVAPADVVDVLQVPVGQSDVDDLVVAVAVDVRDRRR